VSLSDVYPIDMGRRTADADLWSLICWRAVPDLGARGPRVVEIGCGMWRVPRLVSGRTPDPDAWVSVDVDRAMFGGDAPSWCSSVHGDALDGATWDAASGIAGPFDCAVVPYSTLYLIPHGLQGSMLALAAAAVRPGGVVAVECFAPRRDGRQSYSHHCRIANPDGGEPWIRSTLYDVDEAARITRAVRRYGPNGGGVGCRYLIEETIYWRHPYEIVELFEGTGLESVASFASDSEPAVPPGQRVVAGMVPG